MAYVKTVQVPLEEWSLLKALAVSDGRTIAAYLRRQIRKEATKAGIKVTEI